MGVSGAEIRGRGGHWLLLASVVLVACFGLPSLLEAFDSLVRSSAEFAGIDLQLRLRETNAWWSGHNIYATSGHAVYPPVAYLVLRPLFVFTDFADVRKLWGLWSLLLLALTSWGCMRASGVRSWQGRSLAVILPLVLTTTHGAIGNGQVSLLCVVAATGAVLLVSRAESGWGTDLLAAALFIVALTKPTMTAPFFWLICFLPGRWRPAALVVVGYGLATMLSTLLVSDEHALLLIARWIDRAMEGARYGALNGGSVNVQTALGVHHLAGHGPTVALVLIGGLAAWVAGRPTEDPWILLGVSGIVARLAVYHRSYDDLLVLPALVALLRLATRPPSPLIGRAAAGLFAVTGFVMVLPESGLIKGPILGTVTALCWLGCAALLVVAAASTAARADAPAEA